MLSSAESREHAELLTYHDGNEVSLVVRQRTIRTLQDGVMHGEEGGQVVRVVAHHLNHVLQSTVVHEGIHQQCVCL